MGPARYPMNAPALVTGLVICATIVQLDGAEVIATTPSAVQDVNLAPVLVPFQAFVLAILAGPTITARRLYALVPV